MNSIFRVYVRPFDAGGDYAPWIDVSKDVLAQAGSINADLDNTEYDIGVNRFNNFSLKLNNRHGKYSDVGEPNSIFNYRRTNSMVKVTWDIYEEGPMCGFVTSGEDYLWQEYEIFRGLLNDDSATMNLSDQEITFTILGRESIFGKEVVPFGTISNGDLLSAILFKVLNQPRVTRYLSALASNFSVGIDQAIDSIASLQNKTIQEGLNKLLLAGNSVLYIEDDAIKIAPRSPTADVKYTFHGQTSPSGPEKIRTIDNIKSGLAKIFNYIPWKDTAILAKDDDSIQKYDLRKPPGDVDFEFFTDTTKRQNIIDALLGEFKLPKMEFSVTVPVDFDTIRLKLLDRVNFNCPTLYFSSGAPMPICGIAKWGEAVLPNAEWAFVLDESQHFKIMGKSVDISNSMIKFRVRAI